MKQQQYFKSSQLNDLLLHSQLIIFDMNGLIIDDEAVQVQATHHVLSQYGISISEDYWLHNIVGRKAAEFLVEILEEHGVPPRRYSLAEVIFQKNEKYQELMKTKTKELVRDGFISLLSYLSDQKKVNKQYVLAVGTSATRTEVDIILGKSGLNVLNQFEYILTGEDVKHSKPNPEIYLTLSQRAGIVTENCMVFEDTALGVQAAYNAGIKCIAVPNRFTVHQDLSNAVFVIDNLTRNATIIR